MGATNQPEDLYSWKREIDRQLRAIRDRVGNVSGWIGQGGLEIGDNGSLKMTSVGGVRIMFFGLDATGKQAMALRRDNGATIMFTYTAGGNQFWTLTDNRSVSVVSDDAVSGIGLARPWLPIQMHALFSMAANSIYSYRNLPASSIASSTLLWEGRLVMASHPKIEIDGVWGAASGANSSTYRLLVNSVQVGTWSETGLAVGTRGPFDISANIDIAEVPVELHVQASGTGQVAAQVLGCCQRQS